MASRMSSGARATNARDIAPRSVVWVTGAADSGAAVLADEVRGDGFAIEACDDVAAAAAIADLRVLDLSRAADGDRARACYAADPRPTLVVVASPAAEALVLGYLREGDEIARADAAATSVRLKLDRIAHRARESAELALRRQHVDPLTGLPDHTRYLRAFEDGSAPKRADGAVGLLLLDLDNFKAVNERHGRQVGDSVIVEVADRLRRESSPGDRIFRLELEEFVVLFARDTQDDALVAAERFRRAISDEPFVAGEGTIVVTASAGMAFFEPKVWRYGVMHRAFQAMIMAKIIGRNTLVRHDDVATLAASRGTSLDLADMTEVADSARSRLASMADAMSHHLLEEAQREANQDALTRIHNRRYFDARIAREMDLSRRHGQPLTVALIDIDDFRLVNNTYGHPAGDLVLRGFAALATRSIRGVDWLARYGGEEFCLVMPATLPEGLRVAERIRENAAQARTTVIDGRTIAYTVTIGVVEFDANRDADPVQLLHRASKAEHGAKEAGKNRVAAG